MQNGCRRIFYIFLIAVINLVIFLISSYANEVYSKNILTILDKTIENPDFKNIENLKRSFITHKGVADDIITYTLVESLLRNKDKIDEKTVEIVKSFSFYENKKVSTLLNQNFFYKILNSNRFFTDFSIYIFLKYLSTVFIILLFLAFLIKNYYIFMHSHQEIEFINMFYISYFVLSVLILLTIFTQHIFLILSIGTVVLLTFEKNRTKLAILIVILCFTFLNSVTYFQEKNKDFEINSIIKSPTTKKYLLKKAEETGRDIYKIVAEIKYPDESNKTISFTPSDKLEAGNYAVYLLQKGEIDRFNKLTGQYNLLNEPIIVTNIASFFAKTFQYDRYEETIKILYNNYPKYHKLFQEYQLSFKSQTFFPYFTEGKAYITNISFNYKQIFTNLFLIIIVTLFTYFFYSEKIFKCHLCGKVFCIKCDDGYLNNDICEKCRIIFSKIDKADPKILIKNQLKIEKYQYIKKIKATILSLILPGSCRIYLGQNIAGILLLIGYSLLITIILLGYKPFVMVDNLGFHIVIKQLYTLYFATFLIFYIINIFYKKEN